MWGYAPPPPGFAGRSPLPKLCLGRGDYAQHGGEAFPQEVEKPAPKP